MLSQNTNIKDTKKWEERNKLLQFIFALTKKKHFFVGNLKFPQGNAIFLWEIFILEYSYRKVFVIKFFKEKSRNIIMKVQIVPALLIFPLSVLRLAKGYFFLVEHLKFPQGIAIFYGKFYFRIFKEKNHCHLIFFKQKS